MNNIFLIMEALGKNLVLLNYCVRDVVANVVLEAEEDS